MCERRRIDRAGIGCDVCGERNGGGGRKIVGCGSVGGRLATFGGVVFTERIHIIGLEQVFVVDAAEALGVANDGNEGARGRVGETAHALFAEGLGVVGEVGGGEAKIEQVMVVELAIAVLGEVEGGGIVGAGNEAGTVRNIFKLAVVDEVEVRGDLFGGFDVYRAERAVVGDVAAINGGDFALEGGVFGATTEVKCEKIVFTFLERREDIEPMFRNILEIVDQVFGRLVVVEGAVVDFDRAGDVDAGSTVGFGGGSRGLGRGSIGGVYGRSCEVEGFRGGRLRDRVGKILGVDDGVGACGLVGGRVAFNGVFDGIGGAGEVADDESGKHEHHQGKQDGRSAEGAGGGAGGAGGIDVDGLDVAAAAGVGGAAGRGRVLHGGSSFVFFYF